MNTFTAVVHEGETGRWFVAFNPETGTTTQGRTVEQALRNLKEATELYLEEVGSVKRRTTLLTTFELAHA